MANTLTKIASVIVGSGGLGTITFSSIPQTYTDLKIDISAASTYSTYDSLGMYFNGSQANISNTFGNGTGSSTSSNRSTNRAIATINGTNTANIFTACSIYIPNYTISTYKQVLIDVVAEANSSTAYPSFSAELWSSTAAITTLSFDTATSGQNIAQYSVFTLYGI